MTSRKFLPLGPQVTIFTKIDGGLEEDRFIPNVDLADSSRSATVSTQLSSYVEDDLTRDFDELRSANRFPSTAAAGRGGPGSPATRSVCTRRQPAAGSSEGCGSRTEPGLVAWSR